MKRVEYIVKTTKNLTVLLAEDDIDLSKRLKNVLDDLFSQVVIVSNGKEAMEEYLDYFSINDKYYDIVISDIDMPVISGVDLAKQILRLNKEQLFVVISGVKDSKHLIELINIGVSYFIQKPFKYDNFIDVLENVISKKYSNNLILGEELLWDYTDEILKFHNRQIELTANEKKLFKLLIKSSNRVCSNDDIYWAIYELDDKEININKIKSLVKRLRKKLPYDLIQSVYSQGYKLTCF
jgi:DNA-binding response OmpR family regulator